MLNVLNATMRLYEAVHHDNKAKVVRPMERKLEKGLAKAFRTQGKAVVKGLFKIRAEFPPVVNEAGWSAVLAYVGSLRLQEALGDDQLDPILDGAEEDAANDFIKPLEDAAGAMMLAGAKQILGELDFRLAFNLKNPRAVAYILAHGADLVANINTETRSLTKALVGQAVEEGWSYKKTAQALIQQYEGFAADAPYRGVSNRAQFIAVTEAGNAYEEGNYIPVRDLMDSGVGMEKSWDTAPELSKQGPCPECEENNAEGWIPADQAHASGDDHPLAHPICYCDEFYQVIP